MARGVGYRKSGFGGQSLDIPFTLGQYVDDLDSLWARESCSHPGKVLENSVLEFPTFHEFT
jgi:hypothetical protein